MPSVPRLLLFAFALSLASAGAGTIDYNRDIQPILSENCYHCHGPDAEAREADLRLDTKEGAFRTLDGFTPVVPGNPDASELITRILSADRDEVMPPPKSNRKLTQEQRELLKAWVEQGAPWSEHWAFMKPQRPEPPALPGAAGERIKNPIDAFIFSRLEKEGLAPSAEAAKETLLRRVTLDLTGLPPTPQEVEAFVADAAPDAYEKVVDRLLASPRYGERMVWEWLDAARYADTSGFQGDPTRTMWPWRDWVIHAMNSNMPFDQFTVEQLAGDLLPQATVQQKIATGFNRNHMVNNEGGTIAEENRTSYVVDRVDTTSTVWLGLTMTCARCHDHKFDPITQREYFELYAYFNQVPERGNADAFPMAKPVLSIPTPEQESRVAETQRAEKAAQKEREELTNQLLAKQSEWEAGLLGGAAEPFEPQWTAVEPEELFSEAGATLTKGEGGAVLVSGTNPAKDDFVITAPSKVRGITAFRLEALTDESLTNKGPGRADNGNFVLTELKIQGDGKPVELALVSATFAQQGFDAKGAVDGKPGTGWAVQPEFGKAHVAIFEAKGQVGWAAEPQLSIRLEHQSPHPQHVLGKLRISVTSANPATLRPIPGKVRTALALSADQRSPEQTKELKEFYLATSGELAVAQKKADDAKKAREDAEKAVLKVMVMEELEKPRDTFIHVRGAYDQPGEKVGPGTPGILPPLPQDAPANRLALAQWIVSSENPLTARVTVNRYWAMFFGMGLVKTAEDFGVQGEKPSHPELLDWLATEFIRTGWDVKAMHRLMVTSAVYRQSSRVTPELHERDPENRLLARGPRYRLPSWMLRDQALSVGGLLVEKLGGEPVKGYQPPGIWEDATFGQIKYQQDSGEALYRRSLYAFWRRIVGPTMLFDVASRQVCSVSQSRTNTPLHSLTTLNDVTYVEAARALAQRMLRDGGESDLERITFAFQLCTSRQPRESETPVLASALERLRQQYRAAPEAAQKLISVGESKADPQFDPVELAAHTAFGSLLLNLDETLSKE